QPPPPPSPAGPSGASGAPRAFGSQVTPPPPPPTSTGQDSPSKGSAVPSPSKTAASTEHQSWTTPDLTLKPFISLTPADLDMDEAMGPDEQAQLSDDEDIGSAHIPTASALASNYSPPPDDSLLMQTSDIATFMDWFCKRRGITELKPQDLEGPAYEIIKVFHPNMIHLQYQMEECHKLLTDGVDDPILRHNVSKPLPLGGLPGQVTIQSDFFFNKDLEYLRYGSKGRRPALSISKMKAAYYPDAGIEQIVPDQFWIEDECKYDIAVMYARKKRKKGRESPKTPHGSPSHQPPPPPSPAGPSGASGAPRAFGSQVTPPPPPPTSTGQDSPSKGSAVPSPSKTAASTEHQSWTTPDLTLKPFISLTPADLDMDEAMDLDMDEDMGPDEQAQLSDDEDIGSAHIPKASALASNYSPPPEDSFLVQTGDMATFIDWFCKRRECHKLLTDSVDDPILRNNISKPFPLGGPPGQVIIQSDFFFNKDLEYLRYGSKGSRPALSISKIKAAYYPDAGLEQMYLYPSDFEDLYLLNLQGHLNHLPPKDKKILTTAVNQWTRQLVIRQRVEDFQLRIESYQTQLNLFKPQWDATCFKYKHDYTIIDSPGADILQDKYEDESRFKYEVLDQEGRGSMQGVHVRYSKAFEDKADLS
nr:hypothetical protein [Tanacetum cinerariifolium]